MLRKCEMHENVSIAVYCVSIKKADGLADLLFSQFIIVCIHMYAVNCAPKKKSPLMGFSFFTGIFLTVPQLTQYPQNNLFS